MARWGVAYLDGWILPWVLPLFLGGGNMGADIWGVLEMYGDLFLWGQDRGNAGMVPGVREMRERNESVNGTFRWDLLDRCRDQMWIAGFTTGALIGRGLPRLLVPGHSSPGTGELGSLGVQYRGVLIPYLREQGLLCVCLRWRCGRGCPHGGHRMNRIRG